MKIKKILLVLIATVAIVASLAINTFAYSSMGLGRGSLPNVEYFVRKDSTGAEVAYARDTYFRQLEEATVAPGQTILGTAGGDVYNSVRSRWSYKRASEASSDSRFRLTTLTWNTLYNIRIDFSPLPFYVWSDFYGYLDYRIDVEAYNCYNVNNDFTYTPNDNLDQDFKVIASYTDLNVYPPLTEEREFYYNNGLYDILGYISDSLDYTGTYKEDLVYLNSLVIQIDNTLTSSDPTMVDVSIYGPSDSFYFTADGDIDDGKYNFNKTLGYYGYEKQNDGYNEGKSDGIAEGREEGYADGKADGLVEGENIGYGKGYNDALESKGVFDFIFTAAEGFLSTEIFPNFSFGLLLTAIVGLSLLIWILKIFAGG